MEHPPKREIPLLDIIALVSDESIQYLPKLNLLTGSKEATILLLRILKWWQWARTRGQTKFWKFAAPCEHPSYKPGDSWQEELGFTRHEFETALGKIATRIKATTDKDKALKSSDAKACVIYFTNAKRVTYYAVNEGAVAQLMAKCYSGFSHYANAENQHYPGSAENPHYAIAGNPHYLSLQEDHDPIETNNIPTRQSAPDKKGKKRNSKPSKAKDMRHKHPAINLLRGVMGSWPGKAYWDDLIEVADPDKEGSSNLDQRRLKDVLQLFLSVGGYQNNILVWFFEWYVKGVPAFYQKRPVDGPVAERYRESVNTVTENGGREDSGANQASRLRKPLNE